MYSYFIATFLSGERVFFDLTNRNAGALFHPGEKPDEMAETKVYTVDDDQANEF